MSPTESLLNDPILRSSFILTRILIFKNLDLLSELVIYFFYQCYLNVFCGESSKIYEDNIKLKIFNIGLLNHLFS
jgi:hypothetical protein